MTLRLNHLIRLKSLLIVILITFSTPLANALKAPIPTTPHTIDSLKAELKRATTPADSIVILNNLYDCYFYDERRTILSQIYDTALRAGDYDSMLETLFILTVLNLDNPDMEQRLIDMAKRAPESDIQKAYILYIKLRFQQAKLNRATEAERQQKLLQALKDYRNHDMIDIYDHIACLYLICTNLRNTTDSKLLIDYLQRLQTLVDQLPPEELAIRAIVYSLEINSYIENELYDKAVEAIKRNLDLISRFDKHHEAQGRIFRNYDGSLYSSYHNMLVCASQLTDEEIETYYALTREIAKRNIRLRDDTIWQTATRIHYLMAKKRYAEAIPLLKQQIKNNTIKTQTYLYANLLTKAARETGDNDALLEGMKIINSVFRERLMAKPDVSLSELQTIYDVDNLKKSNRDLDLENQQIEISRRNQSIIAIAIAVFIVICLLAWMIRLYIRSRHIARRLSTSNKRLIDERNSHSQIFDRLVRLRDKAKVADKTKIDFVENISGEIREPLDAIVECSHLITDYAKDDDRPYIQDYSDALSINTDLLIRLVNDILDLRQIETGDLPIQRSHSSVNDICTFAIEIIKKHLSPGVEMIFTNAGSPDTNIFTDPQRVEQVLIQILTNAAKFTDSGSITFGYEINQHHQTLTFTVTDTGIGIPADMEEKIFNRFVKMDPTSQGSGLGLYVARQLAEMLGGTLTLDTTYTHGARFLFTIPIH